MQVQCGGTMADVKLLPAFTSKPSPRCLSDVLHNILEGNPDLQLVVVRPGGEDLEHLSEYTAATIDSKGRQETMYLEDLDDRCLDLRADAPQGASRKNTSWHGSGNPQCAQPLQAHTKHQRFGWPSPSTVTKQCSWTPRLHWEHELATPHSLPQQLLQYDEPRTSTKLPMDCVVVEAAAAWTVGVAVARRRWGASTRTQSHCGAWNSLLRAQSALVAELRGHLRL